jgi:hypothetical protein
VGGVSIGEFDRVGGELNAEPREREQLGMQITNM